MCIHTCTCVCKGICHGMCVKFRRQLVGVGSPLLPCESQGQTQAVELCDQHLYPLSHISNLMFSLDGVCH